MSTHDHAKPTRPGTPSFVINDDAHIPVSYIPNADVFAVHVYTSGHEHTVLTVYLSPNAAAKLIRALGDATLLKAVAQAESEVKADLAAAREQRAPSIAPGGAA